MTPSNGLLSRILLNFLNFGDGIKRWVSTFYTGPESAVLNNGFSFDYQEALDRAVLCLFILGAEILACKICQDKEIQGIRIFNSEVKISQFADDTSLICKSCHSVEKAIKVLDSFGNFSGLHLNTAKTKALWLIALGAIAKKNHLGLNGPKNRFVH